MEVGKGLQGRGYMWVQEGKSERIDTQREGGISARQLASLQQTSFLSGVCSVALLLSSCTPL